MSKDLAGLPKGWKVVRLGDIYEIRYGLGQPPERDNNGVPIIRATDIKQGRIISEGVIRVKREAIPVSRNPYLKDGDILVVRSGAYTGDVAMYDGRWQSAIAGYDLVASPANPYLSSQFITNYLLSQRVQSYFKSQSDRSAQSHINADQLRNTPVILPPLEEQRAIATTLRTIQTAKEARQKELALERERKAALMDYLFTHGTRNEPCKQTELGEIPESWEVKSLELLCDKIIDCPHTTPRFINYGIRVIRNFNIRNGRFVSEPAFFTSEEEYYDRIKRCEPQEGDILFSREAPIGEACLIPENIKLSLGQRTMLIRTTNCVLNNYFLVQSFYTEIVRSRMLNKSSGVTAPHLNVSDVRSLKIPLPTIKEQQEIADVLSSCDAKIATLEREINLHDELFRAMLEELMTGKLSSLPLA
jgi:type I restriction enzyme S subunit